MLLAYSKMALDTELLASDLPEAPDLATELYGYFPAGLRERLGPQIPTHPLRREITATVVTNDLVNRAGITFVSDLTARTGRSAPEIARAYLIIREIFELPRLWAEIETLDNVVPARVQTEMLLEIAAIVERAATWLLQRHRHDLAAEPARLAPNVRALTARLGDLLPTRDKAIIDERAHHFVETGVPEGLAVKIAAMIFLAPALDIAELAERASKPLDRAARIYYEVGVRFALDEMRAAARRLPTETQWQKLAVEATIDDLLTLQADLTSQILATADASADDPLGSVVRRSCRRSHAGRSFCSRLACECGSRFGDARCRRTTVAADARLIAGDLGVPVPAENTADADADRFPNRRGGTIVCRGRQAEFTMFSTIGDERRGSTMRPHTADRQRRRNLVEAEAGDDQHQAYSRRHSRPPFVIPAKAGIQGCNGSRPSSGFHYCSVRNFVFGAMPHAASHLVLMTRGRGRRRSPPIVGQATQPAAFSSYRRKPVSRAAMDLDLRRDSTTAVSGNSCSEQCPTPSLTSFS